MSYQNVYFYRIFGNLFKILSNLQQLLNHFSESRFEKTEKRKTSLAFRLSPTDPTLTANVFPKVIDLVCQFFLPTLFYQPEATHLGDLLRLYV